MSIWALDTETRSPYNIKEVGGHFMVKSPLTELLVLCMESKEGEKITWRWDTKDEASWNRIQKIFKSDDYILAHNGNGFDFPLVERVFSCKIKNSIDTIDLWRAYMGSAISLQDISKAFGLSKEEDGKDLIHIFSIPKGKRFLKKGENFDDYIKGVKHIFAHPPKHLKDDFVRYCEQDTHLIIQLLDLIPAIFPLKVVRINERINREGVKIDETLIKRAIETVVKDLEKNIKKTGKDAKYINSALLQRKVEKHLDRKLPSFDQKVINEILKTEKNQEIIDLLKVRLLLASKPEKKLESMLKNAENGRVKNFMIFHGAGTGRYSSRGVQLHNIIKGKKSVWECLSEGHELKADEVTSITRACLVPDEDKLFYVCDFAQIEARISAWLSDDYEKVQDYIDGVDFYIRMASKIYDIPEDKVDKGKRFVAKAVILGLGYGMGLEAFKVYLEAWGITLPEELTHQKLIDTFRTSYKLLSGKDKGATGKNGLLYREGGVWKVFQKAVRAIASGQENYISLFRGRVTLECVGGDLILTLPSGRKLYYRNIGFNFVNFSNLMFNKYHRSAGEVKLQASYEINGTEVREYVNGEKVLPEIEAEMELAGFKRSVCYGQSSTGLHGGLLWENVCQATGADLLNATLMRLEVSGLPASFHVHDEVIVQVESKFECKKVDDLMKHVPQWAKGCPIDVEGFYVPRYAKEAIKQSFEDVMNSKKLQEADKAFYSGQEKVMSDKDYDKLLTRYENSTGEQHVRGLNLSLEEKVPHPYPMLSLKKVRDTEKLKKFLSKAQIFTVEPKLDGMSLELIYKKGKLIQALTRGDGKKGKPVTDKALKMSSIPTSCGCLSFVVRGEVVTKKSDNSRNIASGIFNKKDTADVNFEDVTFYAYWSDLVASTQSDKMLQLSTLGFTIPPVKAITKDINIDEMEKWSKEQPYNTDGIVIKVDNIVTQEKLGETSHHPNWAMAYKFYDETAETFIRNIRWSVGASGKVEPVADIQVTVLSGKSINKITLHNSDFIEKNDIRLGDPILIKLAGGIIPSFDSIVKDSRDGSEVKIKAPEQCPSCLTTIIDGFCKNSLCGSKVIKTVSHFCKKIDAKGGGEKTIKKLGFKSITEMLKADEKAFTSKIGVSLGRKLFNNLQTRMKNTTPEEKLVALSIPSLGKQAVKKISIEEVLSGKVSGKSKLAEKINNYLGVPGHLEEVKFILTTEEA